MFTRFLVAVAFAALSITAASAGEPVPAKVAVVFDQPLPNVPGGASPAPSEVGLHLCHGPRGRGAQQRQRLAGEGLQGRRTLQPGSFHAVSANASDTEPSRLMAVFALDSDEKELVTPAKQ